MREFLAFVLALATLSIGSVVFFTREDIRSAWDHTGLEQSAQPSGLTTE